MKYIILCYDIHHNGLRQKLYKYLLKCGGIPLQKSVIIIPHNGKNKVSKIEWIKTQILTKLCPQDQIHVVPLHNDMIADILSLKSNIDLSFMLDEEICII